MQIEELWKTGRTLRWHAYHPIGEQTVADHAWGVTTILMEIVPSDDPELVDILRYALHHDSYEYYTGDVPYQAKEKFFTLKTAVDSVEDRLNQIHKLLPKLSPRAKSILKWADMFELYLFSIHQIKLGNMYYAPVRAKAFGILMQTCPKIELVELLNGVKNRCRLMIDK